MYLSRTYFFYLFVSVALLSCEETNSNSQLKSTPPKEKVDKTDAYSYKIIFEENVGRGYQIFKGSELLINQAHIPAVQGVKGFETKQKAERTVAYLMKKLDSGIFPPTITTETLDSLEVL